MTRQISLPGILLLLLAACDDKPKEAPAAAPAPASAAPVKSAPVASASASNAAPKESSPAPGSTRYAVFMGKGTFLIDAPLEKIKGSSDETMGQLDINPKDLSKSRGDVRVRLSTLKTSTFGDMERDAAQTEHARNWMEVGNDSPADARMKYEWATFTITSVEATPASLADVKEENGSRKVKAKVSGDLVVHGVTSKKTMAVTATFKGPPDAPTEVSLKSDEPMAVSLKEHDVKPRDKVGSFLNGALDRIGKKIDDKVQVSVEATAAATMPAHP